jgi:hypothetical protein
MIVRQLGYGLLKVERRVIDILPCVLNVLEKVLPFFTLSIWLRTVWSQDVEVGVSRRAEIGSSIASLLQQLSKYK